MTFRAEARFPADPATPSRARAWLLDRIREALPHTAAVLLLDDAAIVVSELMTNAIRAGGERCTLLVSVDADHVRVAVRDTGPGRPRLVDSDSDAEGGRGLHVVSRLSDRWGVRALSAGKEVWAELSLVQARAM